MFRLRVATLTSGAAATLLACSVVASLPACVNDESRARHYGVWKPVGDLPLEVNVTADMQIHDRSGSAKFPTVTIGSSSMLFVVAENDVFWPKGVDEAKTEHTADPNPFVGFSLESVTADRSEFHLEYEHLSILDNQPLYGLAIRRRLDGELYDCTAVSLSAIDRQRKRAMCTSLRVKAPMDE